MIKRWLLFAFRGICVVMLSAAIHAADIKPNVLLIVADDLGVGDLRSFHPTSTTHTPSIDQLASQGMRFTRFYTESTCSASRAALLSGQFPARLGFHPVARGISPEIITMPDWFRQHGYSTHHIGKWHIGEVSVQSGPLFQGFDTSFGFMNQWFLQGPDAAGVPVLKPPVYQDPWLQDESGIWQQFAGYLPDILTEQAVRRIEGSARESAPWFLLYASPLPHAPVHLPPSIASDKDTSEEEQYRAMVEHLDKNVGQLLDAIEHSGQIDNTVIIFMSDNGAPEKRLGSNGPWMGGKGTYTEGGVRTPLVWVDKGNKLPDSVDERVVSIIDIFPSLAARIGKPLEHAVDGLDMEDQKTIPAFRNRILYWLSRDGYSILTADKPWRLSGQWSAGQISGMHWDKILHDSVVNNDLWRWLDRTLIRNFQGRFQQWFGSVVRTLVVLETADVAAVSGSSRKSVTGSNFLRTPLKEWDFYIALKPDITAVEEQVVAVQEGVWAVNYNPLKSILRIGMYDKETEIPVRLEPGCTLLGMNADLYDRYTNLSTAIHSSRLRVGINGITAMEIEWKIDSLRDVAVDRPTQLGWVGSSGGDRPVQDWQGELSDPAMFHQASVVGESALLIDEKKLRTELCAQLGM